MISHSTYPGKALLFGEYTILIGSSALSIPLPRYQASLRLPVEEYKISDHDRLESNRQLVNFHHFLMSNRNYFGSFLDLDRFGRELTAGLYLRSTIPHHYGLGSSGAVCAAIFGKYGKWMTDPGYSSRIPDSGLMDPFSGILHPATALTDLFSRMESFFHGKSSGYDPLVSFIQRPLLWQPGKTVDEVCIPDSITKEFPVTLIDSGQPAGTGSMVSRFLKKYVPGNRPTPVAREYVELTNRTIRHFLQEETDGFRNVLKDLSRLQYEEFLPMIPPSLHALWEAGLHTGSHFLKFCGSGGGGFFLCFIHNNPEAKTRIGESPFYSLEADPLYIPEKEYPGLFSFIKLKP